MLHLYFLCDGLEAGTQPGTAEIVLGGEKWAEWGDLEEEWSGGSRELTHTAPHLLDREETETGPRKLGRTSTKARKSCISAGPDSSKSRHSYLLKGKTWHVPRRGLMVFLFLFVKRGSNEKLSPCCRCVENVHISKCREV